MGQFKEESLTNCKNFVTATKIAKVSISILIPRRENVHGRQIPQSKSLLTREYKSQVKAVLPKYLSLVAVPLMQDVMLVLVDRKLKDIAVIILGFWIATNIMNENFYLIK